MRIVFAILAAISLASCNKKTEPIDVFARQVVFPNGTTINADADLSGLLLPLSPGTSVQITVQRGSGHNTFTVKLGERPPTNG